MLDTYESVNKARWTYKGEITHAREIFLESLASQIRAVDENTYQAFVSEIRKIDSQFLPEQPSDKP